MMDVGIAHMEVFPHGTYFWAHWGMPFVSEMLCTLTDSEKRGEVKPKYGLGMTYLKGTCWIMWAFDKKDVPMALSHEFMHCLLERLESYDTASKFENVSDMVGLGRSILS